MSFIVTVRNSHLSVEPHDLDESVEDLLTLLTDGLSRQERQGLCAAYRGLVLADYLDSLQVNRWLFVLHDAETGKVLVGNDMLGSQELHHTSENGTLYVTDNVQQLYETLATKPAINAEAVYELLTFYTICPPRTIYENVRAVPIGSFDEINTHTHAVSTTRYWDIERRMHDKATDYEVHVQNARAAMQQEIAAAATGGVATGLSGGIDSGGILGMLARATSSSISAISVGPHGAGSGDLVSARETAKENNVQHKELYPSFSDLKNMWLFQTNLNQPVVGDFALPDCSVLEEVQRQGLDTLYNGSGAEMLLGNLRVGKLAYYLAPIERVLPSRLIVAVTKLRQKVSPNQERFLRAQTWIERYMHARGPHFEELRPFFKELRPSFFDDMHAWIHGIVYTKEDVQLLDRIVMMYLVSWVNYMQYRDYNSMSRKFGIRMVLPFNSVAVADVLFKTPNRFRKKNKWSKQVLRDMFAPFVSERLVDGRVKSLVFRWDSVLDIDKPGRYFTYFRTSPIIKQTIDLNALEQHFKELPDPGLFTVRLLSLAAWYDANWNPDNRSNFDAVFTDKAGA